MSNTKTIPATGTTPVLMDTTPLAGGHGREAKVHLGANVGVATGVLLQGHNGVPGDGVPGSGDAGWFTLLSAPQTAAVVEVADLPQWVRKGGATLASPIVIEGVQ